MRWMGGGNNNDRGAPPPALTTHPLNLPSFYLLMPISYSDSAHPPFPRLVDGCLATGVNVLGLGGHHMHLR
jgi:hypothetical protein